MGLSLIQHYWIVGPLPGDVNPVPDVHLGLGEAAVVTIIMRASVIYRSIFEPTKVTIDP